MSPQRATRTSFKPQEGEALDFRMNVRLHLSDVQEIDRLRPDDSRAAVVRVAVREWVARELLSRPEYAPEREVEE